MTNLELMTILGNVRSEYILEAQSMREKQPKVRHLRLKRALLTLAAILVLMSFLCGTAMAASADFRNHVFDFIGSFFPPKTAAIILEGMEEEVKYSAFGEMPDSTKAGFAIYNDYGRYRMTEENGVYYIRPIPVDGVDYATTPPCEMIIEHSDSPRDALCGELHDKMAASWETVREIEKWDTCDCLVFTASNGSNWDSPVETHYFFHDGVTGSYHITAKYFLEASEGHGVRFSAMAASFTLVTPQTAADVQAQQRERMALANTAKDFAECYFNRDTAAMEAFLAEDYAGEKEGYPEGDTVTELLVKGLSDVGDIAVGGHKEVWIEFRSANQPDSLWYLTVEYVKQTNGWKVCSYGLEK